MSTFRLTSVFVTVMLALALALPAWTQAQATIDPVGEYEFSTVVSGSALGGTMQISRGETGYTGAVTTGQGAPMQITAVEVDGDAMTIRVATPQGPATMELELHGTHLVGRWSSGVMAGTIEGQKRRR